MGPLTLNGDRLTAYRASHSRPGVVHALTINVVSGAVWCSETCAAQRRGLPHRHHRELRALLAGLTAIAARTGRPLAATVADLADTLTVQAGFGAETLAQQVRRTDPARLGCVTVAWLAATWHTGQLDEVAAAREAA